MISRRRFVRDALAMGTLGVAAAVRSQGVSATALDVEHSTLVVNGLDPSRRSPEYLAMLKAGGVNCWHQSVGDDFASFASLLEFCDEHNGQIAQADSVGAIRHLYQQGVIAHLSGWQSAEGLIVGGEPALTNLRAYRELGLRFCGIAYNVANEFGGGCFDPRVGLTRAGERLVAEIHRERIILDVGGHTNEQTSFDAIAISAGVPLICSHTNVRALNDNPRCSTDRFFEAIARTGGVIGLSAFNDFHARKASDAQIARTPQVGLDRHLDQYDYLKRLVGVEHIGLGPDFMEGRNTTGWLSPADTILMAPEAYSQETPWFYVKGFENIGELPNVAQGLLRRGWSVAEVRKVLGENWLRVYEKVWGA
jgi:membrane dipeptidase